MWTVEREIEQPIRHVNQAMSGGSFVAIFTLRLAPRVTDKNVRFSSRVDGAEAEHYATFVEQGVNEFVAQRQSEGRPLGGLSVELTKITLHPVDSNPKRFVEAAVMAMEQAMETAGIELD